MSATRAKVSASGSARDRYLRRTYGITEREYNGILRLQKGSCAVCLRTPEQLGANLCVDHNHQTGEIRGLLCRYCNKFIIGRHREDKAEWFTRAAVYIAQGTGLIVPPKPKKKRKKRNKKT